jgi:hypothetical protein
VGFLCLTRSRNPASAKSSAPCGSGSKTLPVIFRLIKYLFIAKKIFRCQFPRHLPKYYGPKDEELQLHLESSHNERDDDIPLLLRHLGRDGQQHQHVVALRHAHGVQVRQHVGTRDLPLQDNVRILKKSVNQGKTYWKISRPPNRWDIAPCYLREKILKAKHARKYGRKKKTEGKTTEKLKLKRYR